MVCTRNCDTLFISQNGWPRSSQNESDQFMAYVACELSSQFSGGVGRDIIGTIFYCCHENLQNVCWKKKKKISSIRPGSWLLYILNMCFSIVSSLTENVQVSGRVDLEETEMLSSTCPSLLLKLHTILRYFVQSVYL